MAGDSAWLVEDTTYVSLQSYTKLRDWPQLWEGEDIFLPLRVLAQAEGLYPEGATLEEARLALEGHLNVLAAAGREVVEEQGYDYPVAATLEDCWFPTKEYEGFALPAGNYTALRVTIGEGKGQNWWCVAFPPLCLGAASETVDQALEAGHFTPGQGALVTGDGEGYVLKFKAMELLGELQGFLEG